METNQQTTDEHRTAKVVIGAVLCISMLFFSFWLAFKGSLNTVPFAAISLMAYHVTLMKRYRG